MAQTPAEKHAQFIVLVTMGATIAGCAKASQVAVGHLRSAEEADRNRKATGWSAEETPRIIAMRCTYAAMQVPPEAIPEFISACDAAEDFVIGYFDPLLVEQRAEWLQNYKHKK